MPPQRSTIGIRHGEATVASETERTENYGSFRLGSFFSIFIYVGLSHPALLVTSLCAVRVQLGMEGL
jgi:hypothetical protein